jgi:hypothetical protein
MKAYYDKEELIKTTAELWGRDYRKLYVYYENEKPIRSSPKMPKEMIDECQAFGTTMVKITNQDKKKKNR